MSIVEPMDAQALAALRAKVKGREYKPSDQMAINLERSAQLYPNSLRSHAKGFGNGLERGGNKTVRFA